MVDDDDLRQLVNLDDWGCMVPINLISAILLRTFHRFLIRFVIRLLEN